MITFYNYNLADFANITPSTENAQFPASNLKDHRRSKVFRSTGSSVNIVFDMLTTEPVDSFCVVDNPQTGFGFATMTLQGNLTADFSSPAFSTDITASLDHEFGIGIKEFAEQNFRFWRLVITGASYVELSKVFIGKKISPTTNSIDYGWSYSDNDLSSIKRNRYGQQFSDEITGQKSVNFSFRLLNKTEVDEIFQVYDYNRRVRPFFMRIGDGSNLILNNENRFAGYFFMDRIPRVRNPAFALYDMSMRLLEGK